MSGGCRLRTPSVHMLPDGRGARRSQRGARCSGPLRTIVYRVDVRFAVPLAGLVRSRRWFVVSRVFYHIL
jgi:hypothetical protein